MRWTFIENSLSHFFIYVRASLNGFFLIASKDTIPDMELHVKLGIPKERGLYQCGKNDLFAVCNRFPIPFVEAGISGV